MVYTFRNKAEDVKESFGWDLDLDGKFIYTTVDVAHLPSWDALVWINLACESGRRPLDSYDDIYDWLLESAETVSSIKNTVLANASSLAEYLAKPGNFENITNRSVVETLFDIVLSGSRVGYKKVDEDLFAFFCPRGSEIRYGGITAVVDLNGSIGPILQVATGWNGADTIDEFVDDTIDYVSGILDCMISGGRKALQTIQQLG